MTVLYNSAFVHRDHHRLRDQLRDLRRNTCWTAAPFRRLRVYTRRHAFHFSTIDSIVAAPMATFSPAFAPIATKVGVGTQKGTLIAVRRLVIAALFRRLRAPYGKPWLITLFRAAPLLYILAMALRHCSQPTTYAAWIDLAQGSGFAPEVAMCGKADVESLYLRIVLGTRAIPANGSMPRGSRDWRP